MKKLLNTLYITKENVYLSRDLENIVILENDKIIGRFPIHIFDNIVCFNYTGCSPSLMKLCNERNINLSFFTPYGKFCGRVIGKSNGNVLVRKKQYKLSEENSEKSLSLVKNIIYAKAYNSRKILMRLKRDHLDKINIKEVETSINNITNAMLEIKKVNNKDSLRGIEGNVAKEYFKSFDNLILKQKDKFYFKGRNKRPPLDCVNALLSFLYSVLANEIQSALEGVGIDSYVGLFHTDRPGRISMALDILEEFRAYLVDRVVINMINLMIINDKDFEYKENGAVLLKEKGREKVLKYWQDKKQEEILHPFLNEKVKIGLLPHIQALLFNRYLRDDIEMYPPFMMKG